jgi:hypoxanthine phosphoribosyltransferase
MENLMGIIGVVSTAILAIIAIAQGYQTVRDRAKNIVSWRTVEKGIQSVLQQMNKDHYHPDAIFAMGRGGAVMAGLMSNKFFNERNIPIFMIDRDMHHGNSCRSIEIRTDVIDVREAPESVLLVAGVNASGLSFEEYSKWLKSKGVKSIRSSVLVESATSKFQVDYYYKREPVDPENLKMPWYQGGIIDWKPPQYSSS